jgi:myo-inositol 2-dehydrogenase/D-chiro-inositol 1-dehydrogenase
MTGGPPADPLVLEAVSTGHGDRLDDIAVAVVGCGVHSTSSILPSIRHARMRLVAVCDLDGDRVELARRQFGAEKAYRSVDEMLARTDLDAVIVVGPPDLHVSAGIGALETGRHVFVEKPPANSSADAVRLKRAGEAAKRQLMVGFMKRRASAYRLVRQVMQDDDFGSVTSVQLTYSHWPVKGLRLHLLDMSIHALDLVRWLLGDPSRMTVYKRSINDNHVVALMLEHPPNAVSQLDLSAFQPGVQERLIVTGEGALVRVENMTEVVYVRQRSGVPTEAANNRVTSSWTPEFAIPDTQNDRLVLQGYATEMIAFADAIRNGLPVDPSIDDGIAAMRLIDAVVDAADGLSTVKFTP